MTKTYWTKVKRISEHSRNSTIYRQLVRQDSMSRFGVATTITMIGKHVRSTGQKLLLPIFHDRGGREPLKACDSGFIEATT